MDFVGKKYIWFSISFVLIIAGAFSFFINGMNYGIDFTGGTTFTLRFTENPAISDVRDILQEYELQSSSITYVSSPADDQQDLLIKSEKLSEETRKNIMDDMSEDLGEYEVVEIDTIGPSIGAELRQNSIIIVIVVLISLLLYITFRFEFWYGVAAITALLHDGLITVGFASILMLEIDTAFVAAVLTVLGYSINDTIVLFDRFRENSKHISDTRELANISIKQTLPRSINTSITTLFVIGALYLFGGATINDFALVLLIGILSGTYSSIFIASPVYDILKRKFQ